MKNNRGGRSNDSLSRTNLRRFAALRLYIIPMVLRREENDINQQEAPAPPDRNRGFQVQHEAKQREGWSLPNTSGKPPLVTGNSFLPLRGTKLREKYHVPSNDTLGSTSHCYLPPWLVDLFFNL